MTQRVVRDRFCLINNRPPTGQIDRRNSKNGMSFLLGFLFSTWIADRCGDSRRPANPSRTSLWVASLRCCAVSGGEEGDMKMIGALLDLNNKPVSQLLWFRRKAIAHRYDLNVPECRQNLWTRHSG